MRGIVSKCAIFPVMMRRGFIGDGGSRNRGKFSRPMNCGEQRP